jgi:hypothetical protein
VQGNDDDDNDDDRHAFEDGDMDENVASKCKLIPAKVKCIARKRRRTI